MRSTYSLDLVTNTLCKNDKQVDIIRDALKSALAAYQWHYQITTDHQQYRNAESGATLATNKVVALLKAKGQDTLANEVEEALYNDRDTSTLVRSKVLSQAKKHMKEYLFDCGMEEDEHNNKYAKHMERIFMEWCEAYPLAEAPASFDSDFEPPIY